jgi:hypothetical protein
MSYKVAAIAALTLMLPAGASAEGPQAEAEAQSNGLGEQNAVASQQSHDQLEASAPSEYQTIGNDVAMAAANAVYAQQQANVTYQAATTVAAAEGEPPEPDAP